MIIDRFTLKPYEFEIEYDSGADVGGEISMSVQRDRRPFFSRTFYFSDGNQRELRAFAKKFTEDAAYREACLNGTLKWARVNRWYFMNCWVYYEQFVTVGSALTSDRKAMAALRREEKLIERRMKQLYMLIDDHINEWEATASYREHVEIERQSPEPSMEALDPGIEPAVRFFNRIPGVVTQFSCEGIRRGILVPGWGYGLVWFPGKHHPLAYIAFSQMPEQLAAELDTYLSDAGIGIYNRLGQAEADCPEHNADFVRACERFALQAA